MNPYLIFLFCLILHRVIFNKKQQAFQTIMMTTKYSIKDLEHLTGIKAHTLRIWEQRYNIIEPKRTSTNIRYYEDEDLKLLLNVAVLVKSGLKISKVASMSHDDIRQRVMDEAQYHGDFESQVNALKIAMLEFDERLFDKVLTSSMLKIGTEETFSGIVAAFIHQVGILWQTNAISITHEHFITNLIKQKLYVAIDQVLVPEAANPKTFLLYLPEGELHEMGLLYIHFKIKKKGHRSFFMGQSLPLESLIEMTDVIKFDGVVSIYTTNPSFNEMEEYFSKLEANLKKKNIDFFVTGYQLNELCPDKPIPACIHVFKTMHELIEELPLELV